MPTDMLDLIQRLCSKAGMLMEEGGATAITIIGTADDPLTTLEKLREDMRTAAALIEAAYGLAQLAR